MQHVTVPNRACLERLRLTQHPIVVVRRELHLVCHICLVALGATQFRQGSSLASSSHQEGEGTVKSRVFHCRKQNVTASTQTHLEHLCLCHALAIVLRL